MLFPPPNFAAVEDDLYRSALPTEINVPFLQQLNLKTVILLEHSSGSADIDPMFSFFLEDNGIEAVRIGEESGGSSPEQGKTKTWQPISEEVVLRAMRELVDSSKYPLLVIDVYGKHRAGILVACIRKIQRWSLVSIFEEYRRYASAKRRLQNEQFVELFDVDLVHIPEHAPTFLRPLRLPEEAPEKQKQQPLGGS